VLFAPVWSAEATLNHSPSACRSEANHLASHDKAENCLIRATMLLDAGASLRIRDSLLESTPLGWACRWGRIDLARLYLERGTGPLEPDSGPWATPLAWATKRGHHGIIALLRSAGAGA
jgi:ankyrin repeat protein